MAISIAIRKKIIEFYKVSLSRHQVAERLKESRTIGRRIIKKYEDTDEMEILHSPGRPYSVRTKKLIEKVRAKVKRNDNRSGRKMAEEYGLCLKMSLNMI